ncbi:L-tryptophan decarboxylase-like [Dendronephthya gigantea]|uniref:L-tryptophan decarboxylase-like n=1 Tax=Dendronephthya gigantea TaxID=151771 RepID=UPI00106B7EB7|nr:L-tryptophan decarboxylase-like [Dendronephthya gigantea]
MSKPDRISQWLPSDRKVIDKWLAGLLKELETKHKDQIDLIMKEHPPAADEDAASKGHPHIHGPHHHHEMINKMALHPPVAALRDKIISDPEINMFFHQMFWQQLTLPDISEGKKIWCWQIMILLINMIMRKAPEYNKTGLVGFPINVILNWPMATTAGFAAFLNDKVNRLFKDILNYWGEFLSSYDSTYVLNKDKESGWFGEDAMAAMPNFVKEFECDPTKPHYGYTSWDDFFVRKYRPGIRPVESPDDDNVVANACESAPFKLIDKVQQRDWFWVKRQHYSLDHLLNNNVMARRFYGGTLYQAFLSATSYHRWHSPVSGHVVKTELVDGSYYSQTYNIRDDPASPNESQGYICQVAARGIIYILADNPDIGLMVFVSVGMSEVSTNEITVKEGDYIKKGDEIGMFHFGGSTHCLIFQPWVNVSFDLRDQKPGTHKDLFNIPVRSRIAVISKPKGKGGK